jgi:hypothetical protein
MHLFRAPHKREKRPLCVFFALTGCRRVSHHVVMRRQALERAIAVVGGSAAFRRALDISPRTLSQWRSTGVPDTRWGDVSRATEGAVSADELALERAAALADAA